jgi:hypothetical protein
VNGAEHYLLAERLVAEGLDFAETGADTSSRLLAAAGVHVKLAEVALAVSLARSAAHMSTEARVAWREIGP